MEGAGEEVFLAANQAAIATGAPVVELREASKWHGDVIGINHVSLGMGAGVTGLLGPNGAGKSTLLRLITGQARPGRGSVRVFGMDPFTDRRVMSRMGYCPDSEALYESMTAVVFVTLMGRFAGFGSRDARRRAEDRLGLVGLAEAAGRTIRGFSKGMRQRAKLAAALVHDPELLVLDEPLNGLDPAGRLEMLSLFRRLGAEGRAVVVSSHVLHEMEDLTDRVALLSHGRLLAEGRVEEIRSMISNQPLTLRAETPDPRGVAAALAGVAGVRSLEIEEGGLGTAGSAGGAGRRGRGWTAGALTIRAERPEEVYAALQGAVVAGRATILSLEALDEDLDAVFGYLTG